MFDSNPDKKALRQGDIVNWLLCPVLRLGEVNVLGNAGALRSSQVDELEVSASVENKKYIRGLLKFASSLAIVISQCCDVEAKDGAIAAPAFVLAPLDPLRFYPMFSQAHELDRLKQNIPDHYSNFFYVDSVTPITEPSVVNFNKVFSVHQSDYGMILSRKSLQLTAESRITFKVKLASHFGRPTEEELQKGLYPS